MNQWAFTDSSTAISLSLLLGLFLGAACRYFGGILDRVVMVAVDLTWSFPEILIALMLVAVVGHGLGGVVFAVANLSYARRRKAGRVRILRDVPRPQTQAPEQRHAVAR